MWVKFNVEKTKERGYLPLYEEWAKKYNVDLSMPFLSKKDGYGVFKIKVESDKFLKDSYSDWATVTEALFDPHLPEIDLDKFM